MTARNKKERLLKKKISRTMKSVKRKMKKDGYEFNWYWYRGKFNDSLILKLICRYYAYELYDATYTGKGKYAYELYDTTYTGKGMKGIFHLVVSTE